MEVYQAEQPGYQEGLGYQLLLAGPSLTMTGLLDQTPESTLPSQ